MDKRIIFPSIFAFLSLGVSVLYGLIFLTLPLPLFVKIFIAIVLLSVAAALVYVIIQRLKELKEEDSIDLGKY